MLRLVCNSLLVVSFLCLSGCLEGTGANLKNHPNAAKMLGAFEQGCLEPSKDLDLAIEAFIANGFRYKSKFSDSIGSGTSGLATYNFKLSGSKDDDAKTLTDCILESNGVFAQSIEQQVAVVLNRQGYSKVRQSEWLTNETSRNVSLYRKNGKNYGVILGQGVASQDYIRELYRRGNSKTFIRVVDLSVHKN